MTEKIISPDAWPTDDDFDQLLSESWQSPPMPASLTRRLDRGIAAHWGTYPDVAADAPAPLQSAIVAATNIPRSLSVAVALAAALMLAFVMLSNSANYAWADVLEALSQQPVLQLESGQDIRQLSLSESATGQSQRTQLFLAHLLQQAGHDVDAETVRNLRMVDESWRRRGSSVWLTVRFNNSADADLVLDLNLDPDTALPRSVAVQRGKAMTRMVALKYPAANPTTAAAMATGSRSITRDTQASAPPTVPPPTAADPIDPSPNRSVPDAPAASLPVGVANQWNAVQVIPRSAHDVVESIDQILESIWDENQIQPVPPASDTELLRRVHLDLVGRTPTVAEVRRYRQDTDPNRYRQLVERLLASSDHASHLATTWRTFLIPDGVDLRAFGGREAFDRWLAARFAAGDSYDAIVRDLLLAEGRLSKSGPLLFYSAAKLDPDQLAARTARVFLGIRLECAQCHDHPFEPWTQKDFWSLAAFFAQISRPRVELENASTLLRVHDVDHGEVMLPETQQVVQPSFLGQSTATVTSDANAASQDRSQTVGRREQLATWLTAADNPYFARATVNRIWGHMFGRGIVDPVDDFGAANPPLSAELLDLLSSQLIASGFDLSSTFRTIALSRPYQLSSGSPPPQTDEPSAEPQEQHLQQEQQRLQHFAQVQVKTLTASQLYDCITVATLVDQTRDGDPREFSIARFGNSDRDIFLQQFATPPGNRTEYLAGIPQALTLMNGGLIGSATDGSSSGILRSLEAPFFTDAQRIEVLFLATLSRPPHAHEAEVLQQAFTPDSTPQQRREQLSDLLWALLNTAEFSLNH